MNRKSGAFDEWWNRVGYSLDPDTEDVSWADKRKGLAQLAFEAAMAQSGNYVADDEVVPREVCFANGRVVRIACSSRGFLEVGMSERT